MFLPEKQESLLFLLQVERAALEMFKSLHRSGMTLLQNAPFCQLIRLDRLEYIPGDVSLQQTGSLRSYDRYSQHVRSCLVLALVTTEDCRPRTARSK